MKDQLGASKGDMPDMPTPLHHAGPAVPAASNPFAERE